VKLAANEWPRHLHRLVLVKWLDAAGSRERADADPVLCLSVGWIVELEEMGGQRYLKLATELSVGDRQYDTLEHVSLPEGMVQLIVPIKAKLPVPFHHWPSSPGDVVEES
jgi:hypothetical protein